MFERFPASYRALGIAVMMIACLMPMTAESAAQDAGPVAAVSGASHDIVMRVSVPVSCRMTASTRQIHLTGKADDGTAVDTTLSGQGGLVVDCNTPYAMTLARTPVFAAPRRVAAVRSPDARSARAPASDTVADLPRSFNDDVPVLAEDMTVQVRVDGREGAMESSCVLARAGADPFVCHAFAGPDDPRLPPPRGAASLIVTGTVERADQSAAGSPQQPVDMSFLAPAALSDAQRAAMDTGNGRERAVVRDARTRAIGRHIGDRLTVSLSARY